MNRLVTDIVSLLFAVVGLIWLVSAGPGDVHLSLLGVGLLLAAVLGRLGVIAQQQREQTELLAYIAEGDDSA